ncbi:hypothetical protein Tco_0012722, partial [Tanacetum coccineum]
MPTIWSLFYEDGCVFECVCSGQGASTFDEKDVDGLHGPVIDGGVVNGLYVGCCGLKYGYDVKMPTIWKMVADSNAPVQDKVLQREFPPCPSPPPAPLFDDIRCDCLHGQVIDGGVVNDVKNGTKIFGCCGLKYGVYDVEDADNWFDENDVDGLPGFGDRWWSCQRFDEKDVDGLHGPVIDRV